jgi:hypothetical protein
MGRSRPGAATTSHVDSTKPTCLSGNGAPDLRRRTVGRIVETAAPSTEGDKVGVLVSLLAGVGVAVGPGPYIMVGNSRHPLLVSTLMFGSTGSGREGEATSTARLSPPSVAIALEHVAQGVYALALAIREEGTSTIEGSTPTEAPTVHPAPDDAERCRCGGVVRLEEWTIKAGKGLSGLSLRAVAGRRGPGLRVGELGMTSPKLPAPARDSQRLLGASGPH